MTAAATTAPSTRRPALDRAAAMRLAADEYQRSLDLLRDLSGRDWTRKTACPGWDVRAMAGHCLGMAEFASSVREGARQYLAALRAFERDGGNPTDHLNALQIAEHRRLSGDELVERYAEVAPRAARSRRRRPALLRARSMGAVLLPDGTRERWTFGFMLDTVLTRDQWMHRIDIATATRRTPELTAEHDGVLVADVVAEWAGRHGEPCSLTLDGPAGGRWTFGSGGPELSFDAVEFCRITSGRGDGEGLMETPVAF
ncbi:maleylpyruvate isomerase family mycothiol-dependent enzyme [Pseudonocardia endophytica]|uniref:Uncharacterized protein (TIGR03083 family) n=1 Tax=Pseudonocardia endophytica TaxID=401976 RepID=A0A4R1HIZ6_PSEEN|nr:maleylpyruvate isomerase family mycothiol-dependent enzyme [Pseudonocardia endophytica]TCK20853.1 uncharacterized protein (TIGR03083 family) [Pseudonocardia endophytica]